MGYDPLSRATRMTRTSLLIFSAIFLSLHLFKLENEAFEILSVPVPDNFLAVALLIAIILLSVSFALYAYDDVWSRDTLVRDKAELRLINNKIEKIDALILKDDEIISKLHKEYEVDLDKRTWMRPAVTAYLEDVKYRASKHLAERHQLGTRKTTLEAAVEAPSQNILSSARFWIIEMGFPIGAIILVVLGWFDHLYWMRSFLGIAAGDLNSL